MINIIAKRIEESINVKQKVLSDEKLLKQIEQLSGLIINALRNGNKVIFAGNGGSFSDSFHFAGEFVSRFLFDRPALPAIALGGNNSIVTATGNDYSFEDIFSRELYALGNKGDIFIPITTSGNSRNILKAIEIAKEKGLLVYGLTGGTGGQMANKCDCLCVPSKETPRIQESHVLIGHLICEIVELKIFESDQLL